MTTRDDAIRAAGAALALVLDSLDALTPREAAQRVADERPDVDIDELEQRIRASRGLPAVPALRA